MIRIGIIGLGFMSATHIKALQKLSSVRLAAICNPSGRHLDGDFSSIAGNLGGGDALLLDMSNIKAFKNPADLIACPDVDLVDLCSPTWAHPEQAIAALQAGKHVLCEKPIARTSAEAQRIADAAQGSRGFFMPAMCLRFWPEWAWLKEAISSGRYGRVLAARFRRVAQPPGWGQNHFHDGKKSGGALLDLHIHDVDFVQYCFGIPRTVFAQGYRKFSGAFDHVIAQYEVECGAAVSAEGGWAMTPGFGFSMSYTVNFENATADYDGGRGTEALKLFEKDQSPRTIKCEAGDGYAGEIDHLAGCIAAGKKPSVVTAADGVIDIRICEAEERSILTRTPIQV